MDISYPAEFIAGVMRYIPGKFQTVIYTYTVLIYVTVNLRNQLFSGIPNPFRESGEFLKCIEIPRNL